MSLLFKMDRIYFVSLSFPHLMNLIIRRISLIKFQEREISDTFSTLEGTIGTVFYNSEYEYCRSFVRLSLCYHILLEDLRLSYDRSKQQRN